MQAYLYLLSFLVIPPAFPANRTPGKVTPCLCYPLQVLGLQYQVAARVKAGQPVTLAGNPFAQPLGPTFREFVLFVLASRHVDPHWMEFHKQCAVCFFDYDFIIK